MTGDGLAMVDDPKSLWIERTAQLIRIRDPVISPVDAADLASAIWERPIVNLDAGQSNASRVSAPTTSRANVGEGLEFSRRSAV